MRQRRTPAPDVGGPGAWPPLRRSDDMQEDMPRVERCNQCGSATETPVLAHIIESGSGPGAMLYDCVPCARRTYHQHVRVCIKCRSGINCREAVGLWTPIQAVLAAKASTLGQTS